MQRIKIPMIFSFYKYKSRGVLLWLVLTSLCGVASSQTLSIVSGNGQLLGPSSLSPQPLTVQLLDATNKPYPGQTITFSTLQDNIVTGGLTSLTATTDSNGQASVNYVGANLVGTGLPFVANSIVATYGVITSTFTETTVSFIPSSNSLQVIISVLNPIPYVGPTITGSAGSTGITQPIQVNVSTPSYGPLPNISLTISTDSSSTGSISCKEGNNILTDVSGNATCTPLFGKVGPGTFTITVGSFQTYVQNQFVVTPGNPGIINVISGNNQSGLPGQTLATPIVGQVTDLAGNVLSGVQVVFSVIPAGAATLTNTRTTSDANGRVSANVVLGSSGGPVQITIRDANGFVTSPAVFTETVSVSISGITKVSGDSQSAFTNTAFAQQLVVQVNNTNNQPVPGVTVQFALTGGSAFLSSSSAVTDGNGRASISVTASAATGAVTISASTGGFSQTFNLTVIPPGPTNITFYNGASFQQNSLSPGSVVTIVGQGLVNGNNVQGAVVAGQFGPLPYMLAGVSVTIGGIPAPLFNVVNANGQQSVTAQIPFEVSPGTVPVVIAISGGGSATSSVTISAVSPGIFQTVQSDGVTRAVALRSNGTVVTPTNPAGRGENIRIYLTGLGPLSPTVATGTFSPYNGPDPTVTNSIIGGINDAGATVVQTIYARNLIGVYEMTLQVPTDTVAYPSGSRSLSVGVNGPNGTVYSNTSAIYIQ